MERIVRVTGKGKMTVHPDTIRLCLDVEGIRYFYGESLEASAAVTEEIKTVIERLGFRRKDLKTLNFRVDAEYDTFPDERTKEWKREFCGYKYVHRMKLEFREDNERLGKVLYALAHSEVRPEISIEYTIADPEEAKKELLRKAVHDSREKAEIMALAAGVQLGSVQTIDYSWDEIDMCCRPINRGMLCEGAIGAKEDSYEMDIEAEDIDIADSVTVVWQIL